MKNINLGRRVFVGASTMLFSTALVSRAFAQTWPTGSVRVVEPGLPGGGNDTTIRLFTPLFRTSFWPALCGG